MSIYRYLLIIVCFLNLGFSWPPTWFEPNPTPPAQAKTWLENKVNLIRQRERSINEKVLRLSLIAYWHAYHKGLAGKKMLTVVDFSRPSSEKRLWVFDIHSGKTLFNTWVTHGRNSGELNATSFSNQIGSLKSSLGLYLTEHTYVGHEGYSLRLIGLERGINDHAYHRAIIVHGAWYVNPATINKYGQIGRSWGCLAVSEHLVKPLINTIKERTLIFAYYPDHKWLSHSQFLTA